MTSIVVTPTVEAGNIPPRVRLDVVDAVSPLYSSATIVRNNADGTTVPVRTGDGNALPLTVSGSTTVGLLYDYEVPFTEQVTYSSVESPANVSAAVTVPVSVPWLVHPGVPSLSMPISLRPGTLQDMTLAVKQGVFYPMGRTNPIVVNDGSRKAPQSSLTVSTGSLDELSALRALIADAGVLLLNLPADGGYGFDSCYVAVQDVTLSRWTDTTIDGNRDVKMPFTVVDRPAGGSSAQRTFVDLLSFASLGALEAAYGTFGDLLAGP